MPSTNPSPQTTIADRPGWVRSSLAIVVALLLGVGAPLAVVAPAHADTIATEDFDDLSGWTVSFWSASGGNAVAGRGPGGGGSISTTASFSGFENIEVSIRYRVENLAPTHAFFFNYNPGGSPFTPLNRTTDTAGFVTETYPLDASVNNDASVTLNFGNVTPSPDPMPIIEVDSMTITGDPIDTTEPTIAVVSPTDGAHVSEAGSTSFVVEVGDNATADADIDVDYSFHFLAASYPVTPSVGGAADERTASVAGLTLETELGLVAGDEFEWRITAVDDEGNDLVRSVEVIYGDPIAPVVTTTNLPGAVLGEFYSLTTTASGTDPITFSATGLPGGLTIDSSGVISGTPTAGGSFSVTIEATNSVDSDEATFELIVEEAPSITTVSLPDGFVGSGYVGTLEADGDDPKTYTASGLPPGILFDAATGALTGEPTTAGSYSVEFTVTNSAGSDTVTLDIDVLEAPSITSGAPPSGVVGAVYSHTVTADGSPAPTFSVSGTLPPGLGLDPTSGLIDGAPTTDGSFTFTITATNGVGADDTAEYTVVIEPAPAAPAFTSGMPGDGVVGVSYSFTLTASGYPAATFSVGPGSLPPGLVLDATSGAITGFPTTAGTFDLTLVASNGVGSPATLPVTIEVREGPEVGSDLPPTATVGVPYSFVIPVTGTDPFTFSIGIGALPAGLELDETTGEISGTPASVGSSPVFISVTNETGLVDSVEFVIIVAPVAVPEPEIDSDRLAQTGANASGVVYVSLMLLILGAGARLLRRSTAV